MEHTVPHPSRRFGPLSVFFLVLLAVGLLRVLLGFVGVPLVLVGPASVAVTVIFVAAPILALFFVASKDWSWKLALAFVLGGGLVHGASILFLSPQTQMLLSQMTIGVPPLVLALVAALGQIGLVTWCTGLGALLVTLIKDKNLIIPIAIFLAAFDIFLVLTPAGPTQQILKSNPQIFESLAYQVPKVQAEAAMGPVAPFAFIGPADFLFCAMFFVALFRFKMRTRQTLVALVPTLLVYLALAYFMPLPALVPIGLVVLAINLPEFRLSRDEWAATGVVAAIGIGLILWGATRPAPPVEPSPKGGAPAVPGSEGSPATELPDRSPSEPLSAPGSTPGPR